MFKVFNEDEDDFWIRKRLRVDKMKFVVIGSGKNMTGYSKKYNLILSISVMRNYWKVLISREWYDLIEIWGGWFYYGLS